MAKCLTWSKIFWIRTAWILGNKGERDVAATLSKLISRATANLAFCLIISSCQLQKLSAAGWMGITRWPVQTCTDRAGLPKGPNIFVQLESCVNVWILTWHQGVDDSFAKCANSIFHLSTGSYSSLAWPPWSLVVRERNGGEGNQTSVHLLKREESTKGGRERGFKITVARRGRREKEQ